MYLICNDYNLVFLFCFVNFKKVNVICRNIKRANPWSKLNKEGKDSRKIFTRIEWIIWRAGGKARARAKGSQSITYSRAIILTRKREVAFSIFNKQLGSVWLL